MRLLNPQFRLDDFLAGISVATAPVLMLDYDGTLAPFRVERDRAVPYPGIRKLLEGIIAAGRTRLIVITGRSIDDLRPLLGLNAPPEIWGSHGLERMHPDGTAKSTKLPESLLDTLVQIRTWATQEQLGKALEIKPFSIAIHWRGRQAAEATELRMRVRSRWQKDVVQAGLEVREFDGGIEIRPIGIGKGDAVRSILQEIEADQPVAFMGDDTTDEDGFDVLFGRGLSVLVRPEFRRTNADLWLTPPAELIDLLTNWL